MSPKEALKNIGKLVIADAGINGCYIGKLEDVIKETNRWFGKVDILGVTRYPLPEPNYNAKDWTALTPYEYKATFLTSDTKVQN